jgi:DNA replicative helicase MCM subunit Mcm2 (Cdc46/Mcm family)
MLIFSNLENLKSSTNEKDLNVLIKYVNDYLGEKFGPVKDQTGSITIDLIDMNKVLPFELRIYDNAIDRHEEFHSFMKQAVEDWSGNYRDIYYKIPDDGQIELTNFESVNHHKVGKLVRLKGIVDNYQTFISVPVLYIYECFACGEVYKLLKRQKIICKCGKHLNKHTSDELHSRMYFNIMEHSEGKASNMVLCYFEVGKKEYQQYLFHSGLIGEYIEILGSPKKVETILNKEPAVAYEIEVKGLKPSQKRYVSEKRKQEIIKIIKEDENAFENIAESITKRVYGYKILKQLILAVCVGLKKPDIDLGRDKNPALHLMVVGDPSIGKSYTAKQFLHYFHKSSYIQGVSSTAVGLLGGCDRNKQGGFIIRSGQVQKSSNSFLILDEMDKIKEDTMKGLFTALSEGTHTLTNITGSHRFEYNTSFILIANPKGGKFDIGSSKYAQIDLDPAFLSRVDIVHIPTKPYLKENSDVEIDPDKYAEYQKYRSGRKTFESHYDENFLLDYAQVVKEMKNPTFNDELKIKMEKFSMEKMLDSQYTQQKGEFDDAQNIEKKQIDERFMNTVYKVSKIVARASFSKQVHEKHFNIATNLIEEGMLKSLITKQIDDLTVVEEKIRIAKTITIPKTTSERREYILMKVPRGKIIDDADLMQLADDVGINDIQYDKIIKVLLKEGEIFEQSRNKYSRN